MNRAWAGLAAAVVLFLGQVTPGMATMSFESAREYGGHGLVLLGSGTARYAGLFKVYDAALYGPATSDPGQLLATDSPRCLELRYRMQVDAEKIRLAAATILGRQHADLTPLQERIGQLQAAYVDVDEGDIYTLCYSAGKGSELSLNGSPLVAVPGADFAAAYFGIWLAEESISESLRAALTGR